MAGGGYHGCGAARGQLVWLHQVQSGQQEEFNQHGYVVPWKAVFKTNHWRRSDLLKRVREFPLGTTEGDLDSEPLELSTYCKEECWVCFSILKFTLKKKRKSSFHIKFLLSSIWGLKVWCS